MQSKFTMLSLQCNGKIVSYKTTGRAEYINRQVDDQLRHKRHIVEATETVKVEVGIHNRFGNIGSSQ